MNNEDMMMRGELPGERAFAASQFKKEKKYWLDKLSGELVNTGFPPDIITTITGEKRLNTLTFQFPPGLVERLMEIVNYSDSKLHMVLTTGLTLLLYKYTGHTDIIIGTPIDKQEEEGEFINTALVLRNQIEEQMSVKECLMQVRQTILEANYNQNYPLETIAYDLDITAAGSDFSLFDTAILLENIQDKQYIKHMNLNMVFSFLRTGACLEGELEYNSSLFKKQTIEQLTRHFLYLMEEAFSPGEMKLIDIHVLTEEERYQMVTAFNNTTAAYPGDKMIHRLFEEQVKKTPDITAVEARGEIVTYEKLNQTANQLARLLNREGIGPGTAAAIMLESSIEVPIAVMAVLKAGTAYLPIGLECPRERINYLLKDSQTRILITRGSLVQEMAFTCPIIDLEYEIPFTGNKENLEPVNASNPLAYIIYTSGTTGQPKGVTVEHRGLVNYIYWAGQTYIKGKNLDFPLYTSISFDLTVTSVFTPLITGNAIIVYGGTDRGFYIEKIIDENRVGVVKLTPSHMKLIRHKKVKDSRIKCFIVGGETLETQLAREIYNNFNKSIEIYNEYGPTETVVGSMIYKFNPGADQGHSVPIGIPIANTQIYLLNKHLQPVPVGVNAEIYISGDGVSRGYLNNPGLTHEKFVPNPFIPGQKMYRTGDLGVRLPNGDIEFKARTDHQVKIRGYRVETDEIESKIHDFQQMSHAQPGQNVAGAVVTDVENQKGEKALCAYILADKEFNMAELRVYLSKQLPEYMIPMYFSRIDKIPLTPGGKLDRKALPKPKLALTGEYLRPRNEVEKKLSEVWSNVLGLKKEKIGIDMNFFEVGGHSLGATFLAAAVSKHFNVKISLVKIFETPTIRGLAEYVKSTSKTGCIDAEPVEKKEYYDLSLVQKRFYIQQQLYPDNVSYSRPILFILEGNLEKDKLEDTFRKLIKRNENFRTSFEVLDERVVQRIYDEVDFSIDYYEAGEEGIDKLIEQLTRPFDLCKPPLMRVALIKQVELKHLIKLDIHHIINDGITFGLLIRDLMAIYEGKKLPPLKLQYTDFSEWQSSEAQQEIIKKQGEYWFRQFKNGVPGLELPYDYPRPQTQRFEGDTVFFEISAEETKQLRDMTLAQETSLYMVLFSFYFLLLWKLTGQEDIVVGTAVSGRRHTSLVNIMGLFFNTLPIRHRITSDKTFEEFLSDFKGTLLKSLENQEYPLDRLLNDLSAGRQFAVGPGPKRLFDTMFSLQNFEILANSIPEIEIPGLKLIPYQFKNKTSRFDLFFITGELDNRIEVAVEYATAIFKRSTIEQIARYYREIVTQVLKKRDIILKDITLSSDFLEVDTRIEKNEFSNFGF